MPLTEVKKTSYFSLSGVRVQEKVHCGCGFSTERVDDGVEHARTTGHTLHIVGEIRVQK